MGDFNSYTEEDPIDVLRAAGLQRNLMPADHSYKFGSEFGSLDHALSTSEMSQSITGAGVWHINSDEPAAFNYTDANISRYQPNAFRCSDHDPVVVGFNGGQLPVGLAEMGAPPAVSFALFGSNGHWRITEPRSGNPVLTVFDGRGSLVRTVNMSGGEEVVLGLSDLAPGIHFWRISGMTGQFAAGRFVLP
jgi:hypothetical protein